MTRAQAAILDAVAEKHHQNPLSVALIASAMGPPAWRGCHPCIDYVVPKDARAWTPRREFDWGLL